MNRDVVEQIKSRLPIEEIVGNYVKLEKAGKSYKGKCPFHNEKTASFFVSPDRGGYYCFGCGVKGDIFTFVEQFEGLDFRGALKVLAEKAGVEIRHDQKADGERDSLLKVMEEAANFFSIQYDKSVDAQNYVKGRGILETTQKSFRIGWAPEGWRNLSVYLKGKGFSDSIMEKAGLIKKKDGESASFSSDSYYDRFRGRIMFPISDSSGRVIAFSGRILKDDGKSAKYLNSPDTSLYDKSMVLYGLDKAKTEIRRLGYTILVEGQMDLVMSHQAGIRNTVAASGTALTGEVLNESGAISNLGLVKRLSPNVIIAFDSDAAGQKAAMRAAAIALGMSMDVKIAHISGGKDPADLVKDNVENWKSVLRESKQVIEYELNNIIREVSDARKISKIVQDRLLPLVARIESPSDRSHFVQMIADKAKMSVDILWQDLAIVERRIKETIAAASTPNTNGQNTTISVSVRTSGEQPKRMDIVERRLFGLLHLMEKESMPEAAEYRAQLQKIAEASYPERRDRAEANMNDLLFEAESFFGDKPTEWGKYAAELLANFEEDMIGEELIKTMQELKAAERDGNSTLLSELAKKCQVLSLRKSEIGRKARNK